MLRLGVLSLPVNGGPEVLPSVVQSLTAQGRIMWPRPEERIGYYGQILSSPTLRITTTINIVLRAPNPGA